MEKIFLEKFVNQHGAIVEVPDSQGKRRKIKDSDPESWELAKNADLFRLEGKWHNRAKFEKLVDQRLKPANAIQIALPPLNEKTETVESIA